MSSRGLIEFELWSKGEWPRRDVVGETFHADAIRSLFPRAIPEGGQELFLRAVLLPDPENPHDRNAVKVLISGQQIGHLSQEDAMLYQPVFGALVQRGFLPTTSSRVWGSEYDQWVGFDRRGGEITKREFNASVSVTLDEWYLCVPANQPPVRPHTMLPYGAALQVRKEENHQDMLRRYVTRQGQCWAYGTLHAITEQTARASKDLVEVRIDDQRVGDLTPAMSAEYLPVIGALAERERVPAVRLIVKGNQVKAEVVLHAQKAHQLDASWVADHLDSAGPPVPAASPPVAAAVPAPVPSAAEPTVAAPTAAAASPPSRHAPIPSKPTHIRIRVPPGWPHPPSGWEPPPGWHPDPSWPPAPSGWQFWQLGV